MTEPYKDVKKSGAKGIATGLGKGAVGMVTKSGAGMFGLLAYPASGIAKSLRSVTHTRSRKAVEAARRIEGAGPPRLIGDLFYTIYRTTLEQSKAVLT